jgi:hypothetical protein
MTRALPSWRRSSRRDSGSEKSSVIAGGVGPVGSATDGRWKASEDRSATWRKDFDLIFERTGDGDSRSGVRTVRPKKRPARRDRRWRCSIRPDPGVEP